MHYLIVVIKVRICSFCGSDKDVRKPRDYDGDLCIKHYTQYRRYGKILDRTRYDKNEIIKNNEYAEVILYDSNQKEVARAKIDIEDIDRVKDFKWGINSNGYAYNRNKVILMHRYLMDIYDENLEIDHKNGDRLDNRKDNLRICTRQRNIFNSKPSNRNTSGFKGVGWDKRYNKWRARINVSGKEIFLGYFDNFDDAVEARVNAEKKYFGEYSYLNRKGIDKHNK